MTEKPTLAAGRAMEELLRRRNRFVARGVASAHPIFADWADGSTLRDVEGKDYLDFTGGIGVMNVGHRHPLVVKAVQDQLERFSHLCFQVSMYEAYVALAERLSSLVNLGEPGKVIFLTTGAEAIENAVKIARAYTKRRAVVAFTGGFHGRTLLALTLTASGHSYRQNFGPFAPEVYHVPFPYEYRGWSARKSLDALAELFETQVEPGSVAAVVIEPQLGEGGFIPGPLEFLRELRRITANHGIVLILDEIQTGFGRTGKMFAFEHYEIQPDLVAVAKSIAAGLPLSGVVGKAAIMDAPSPGGLGGTYGGNPLACAAALAVLDIFERENLVARAERMGQQVREALHKMQERFPRIGDVRGLGAMLAVELVKNRERKEPDPDLAESLVAGARDRGLLLLKCGADKNVIRFLPPLTTSEADIERGLEITATALAEAGA